MHNIKYNFTRSSVGPLLRMGNVYEISLDGRTLISLATRGRNVSLQSPQGNHRLRNRSAIDYDYRLEDGRSFLKHKSRYGMSLVDIGGLRYETKVQTERRVTSVAFLRGTVLQNDTVVLELSAKRFAKGWRSLFLNGAQIEGTITTQMDDPYTLAALVLALHRHLDWNDSE